MCGFTFEWRARCFFLRFLLGLDAVVVVVVVEVESWVVGWVWAVDSVTSSDGGSSGSTAGSCAIFARGFEFRESLQPLSFDIDVDVASI